MKKFILLIVLTGTLSSAAYARHHQSHFSFYSGPFYNTPFYGDPFFYNRHNYRHHRSHHRHYIDRSGTISCLSFPNRAAAQSYYYAKEPGYQLLDRNGNGIVCESLR